MARASSHLMSVIRGSVGGLTYTANQWYQLIMKARTAPVQPQTEYQQFIRGAFKSALSAWSVMTQAQRNGWQDYADTCTYIGPLGPYTVTGRNMWIAVETFRDFMNAAYGPPLAQSLDPPVKAGWVSIGAVSVGAPGPGITGYTVTIPNPEPDDMFVVGTRSLGFKPTRLRYKGPWSATNGQALEVTASTSGAMTFPSLDEESVYFGVIRGILSDPPYRITQQQFYRAVAIATPI